LWQAKPAQLAEIGLMSLRNVVGSGAVSGS
jgi:hypothetical protein